MKIILAPDKFKGSLTSFEACNSMREGILLTDPDATVFSIPLADGGDGFATVLKHYLDTTTIQCDCSDPLGRPMHGYYEWDLTNKTAIIELAIASGLVLLESSERNPLLTSTYGTGLLILDAMRRGAKKILLGLGGSATNDAGIGILSALGFIFNDRDGNSLWPTGGSLLNIDRIIPPVELPALIFEIACDVTNPLFGANGAAEVYGPQKGANANSVKLLDEGLRHFSSLVFAVTGRDLSSLPGTGAAGGIAAGLMPYFTTHLKAGIGIVAEASDIEAEMQGADLVITGEGQLDKQTEAGKVVAFIAELGNKFGVPVIALGGSMRLKPEEITELGLAYASSIGSSPISLESAMKNAYTLLMVKSATVYQFWKSIASR